MYLGSFELSSRTSQQQLFFFRKKKEKKKILNQTAKLTNTCIMHNRAYKLFKPSHLSQLTRIVNPFVVTYCQRNRTPCIGHAEGASLWPCWEGGAWGVNAETLIASLNPRLPCKLRIVNRSGLS